MGRKIRLDTPGYYHISNRGVGLRDVFLSHEDKIFFISLMCRYAKEYTFVIHGYALISNGYDILIETTQSNLSVIMRMLNSRYTSHFNKKIGRRGHLWEGRYKSWHIDKVDFVLKLLAYIEALPIYAGCSSEKSHYFYASYRQFIGADERLPCLEKSIIFKRFNTVQEIKNFYDTSIDFEHINSIHKLLKRKKIEHSYRNKKRTLSLPHDYFQENLSKDAKKQKICEAYLAGYSQKAIGENLHISQQAVHKIIKRNREQE